ncbi:hypothetical protein [Micromonospora profundi]|uniref:hypothetical protein n=1 Tax=Micromonospora profundi TaxID=1420889 RepID=UPI003810CBF4
MLPVALTCPLWWVARWSTRLLTSFVVAALALGPGPQSTAAAGSPPPAAGSATVGVGSSASSSLTAAPVLRLGLQTSVAAEMAARFTVADVSAADEATTVRSTDPVPPSGVGGVPAATAESLPARPATDPLPRADEPTRPGTRAPPGR